ncbi:transcriptional regulator, BadM/Rrf2 family [Emticicia oligotrophica DSM 17448]|uniref:Transcriptional regulator, BadM/Rrf2 family n=1 Tax=Emticicia oligotrophica (strain DSM 17448 / CIP 109782 / MTCC 6937 / GPTSA100-15) TaxID=929562 RepID=A0ABM5MWX5_EMTOG|nr:Rrf2 family transcriptional regulator [Emticicia oligotrophica]AFK01607.1 transcriptional regulator, BadM/Rrf2 family [Emticicia oligotrophica DSM 17448]
MISKKAKYALKALKVLTEKFESNEPTLINDIAVKEKIPKKFLEAILLELRNQGVLKSQKGKGGGYLLRMSPTEVSVAKVLRIIDGPIAPTPCVSVNFYGKCDDCESEELCSIRPIMMKIRNANLEIYENTNLVDLVKKDINSL